VDVGGQSAPSFTSRKVTTHLRLREGEANLLAGLIRQDTNNNRQGLPWLMRVPVIKQLFSGNELSSGDTDIVMLITPHIVRSHELTAEDVANIYIGTQANVGLTGPPPLIAPVPEAPPAPPAPATPRLPNAAATGAQGPPVAAPPGAQTTNPPAPPGTQPVPGFQPPPGAPAGTPPTTLPAPGAPPVTAAPTLPAPTVSPANPATPPAPVVPPARDVPPATAPASPSAGVPAVTAAQILITPPGEFRVAGGPYTTAVSINNASRVSTLSLTITYNPAILSARTVQDGTFMRQGGLTAAFAPKIDRTTGRIDIVISRAGDQTGASGAGLLAAVLFDALAPGTSAISVTGVANGPDGAPVTVTFSPVTVTVR
jgi:general secretion pathway protein D